MTNLFIYYLYSFMHPFDSVGGWGSYVVGGEENCI